MKEIFITILVLAISPGMLAQEINYGESRVPDYELPELLVVYCGKEVRSSVAWEMVRRQEIMKHFEKLVYGQPPRGEFELEVVRTEDYTPALQGRAVRKQVELKVARNGKSQSMDLLIYLPAGADGPVPLFLGFNFYGNHTIIKDTALWIPGSWVRNIPDFDILDNRATEYSRGLRNYRWPVDRILSRGYGLAVLYYGDIDPDYDDGYQNGVHALYPEKPGDGSYWGSIAAWAWGLSRAMDYLQEDPRIDGKKVAVIGHSRLGKTALWAGARDERFALVISNNSGCGGAALSRRMFGETVERINATFSHWFCSNFHKYNDRVADLPVDQHMLIALIAPRPVYVASAEDDLWADPYGEYLSCYHAAKVYELYDAAPEWSPDPPRVNQVLMDGNMGYHKRSGVHNLTFWDWEQYLDFADRHFSGE